MSEENVNVEVKYVNYGIANRFENVIELNERLKEPKYKELHDYALEHELKHTPAKLTSFWDMMHDYFGSSPIDIKRLYFNFLLNVPSSRIQLSPAYPAHGRIYIDANLLVFYLIIICLSWIMISII
jgi:hypothetical protein